MAIHWRIPFKSLRQGRQYYINIYSSDSLPSGYPLTLKGGAEPFETKEDDDEDMFAPIRTQSGAIRIVNNKKATSVNSTTPDNVAFDWHDLLPSTDTDRPVTLTDGSGNVYWQGFIQAQNYGATLYGDPQEIELPVQCPITALQSLYPTTTDIHVHNFAYLLKYAIDRFVSASNNALSITHVIVQGSTDARTWLMCKFDWQNLLKESDNEDVVAKYNLNVCLEDMCKFWGWTLRIQGTKLYLMRVDDTATVEKQLLTMTYSNLATMAGGAEAGTTGGAMTSFEVAATDAIFASNDNDDFLQRGPNKASVQAEVNEYENVIKFAPYAIRKQMEASGYTWHNDSADSTFVGYFSTDILTSVESAKLKGTSVSSGGFARRQIFSEEKTDKGTDMDVMCINQNYVANTPLIQLQLKTYRSYHGGSLTLNGSIYNGSQSLNWSDDDDDYIIARLGIGPSHDSADTKWFRMDLTLGFLSHGWYTVEEHGGIAVFAIPFKSGKFNGSVGTAWIPMAALVLYSYPSIPLPENDTLEGYIFFDILGARTDTSDNLTTFQIGDFSIEYSRDQTYIENAGRPARKMNNNRRKEYTYKSSVANSVSVDDKWNADCIYASDNNMEYGLGLLMDSTGAYIETVNYSGTAKHPEQQLADRVTAYWASNKRRVKADLQAQTSVLNSNTRYYIDNVSPLYKITLDGTTMHPISISRKWRDDVVTLTMMEV